MVDLSAGLYKGLLAVRLNVVPKLRIFLSLLLLGSGR